MFDTVAYTSGTQHMAYWGDRHRLNEYTGLAALAYNCVPAVWYAMVEDNPEPAYARDAWTWAAYLFAWQHQNTLPVDAVGDGPYATGARELSRTLQGVACAAEIADLRVLVPKWQAAYGRIRYVPRYVYAGMVPDVFAASYLVVDHILRNADTLFFRKKYRVLQDYEVYALPFVTETTLAQKVHYHMKVDVTNYQVKVGRRFTSVTEGEALFFDCLVRAGGGPLSGVAMKAMLPKGSGQSDFRPERIRKKLKGLLKSIVVHTKNAPYQITFDGITKDDFGYSAEARQQLRGR